MISKIDETKCAGCGICVNACPTDMLKMDLVYYYDGLCEQDLIQMIYQHSYERLKWEHRGKPSLKPSINLFSH